MDKDIAKKIVEKPKFLDSILPVVEKVFKSSNGGNLKFPRTGFKFFSGLTVLLAIGKLFGLGVSWLGVFTPVIIWFVLLTIVAYIFALIAIVMIVCLHGLYTMKKTKQYDVKIRSNSDEKTSGFEVVIPDSDGKILEYIKKIYKDFQKEDKFLDDLVKTAKEKNENSSEIPSEKESEEK